MRQYITSLTVLFILSANSTQAQDDQVKIHQKYIPQLLKSEKLYSQPQPETAYISPPPLKYKQSAKKLEGAEATLTPIKTIALPAEKLKRLYGNFLKLGYGNFNSPFIDGSLSNLRSKSYMMGVNVHHYSNNGSALSRKMSETYGDGYLKRFTDKYAMYIKAGFRNNSYKYYGVDPLYIDSFQKSDYKINYQLFDLHGGYETRVDAKDTVAKGWKATIDYYNLVDQYKRSEMNFTLGGIFNRQIRANPLETKIIIDANGYKGDYERNRTFIKLNPVYSLAPKNFKLSVGFNFVYLKSDEDPANTNEYRFYPVVKGSYIIPNANAQVYGYMNGDQQKNTLLSLSQVNPFLAKNKLRLLNTSSVQAALGIKGTTNGKWGYNAQLAQHWVSNLPLFVTNQKIIGDRIGGLNQFLVLYADGYISHIKLEASYLVGDQLKFTASGNYYKYKLEGNIKAWNMPNAELKLQGAYLLAEKFMIRADVFAMTKRYGNSFSDTAQTKFEAIKVPGLVDFNVGCDYRYSKYVSAFINFNNLTAVRYQRWYHYPVSGFNLLAGLTMTF